MMTQPDFFSKLKTYPDWFEDLWSRYPSRPGNPKRNAYRAYNTHCRHYPVDLVGAGVDAYRKHCEVVGSIGTPYVMMAATFFGPALHFLEDWDCEELSENSRAADLWDEVLTAASGSLSARRSYMEGCDSDLRAVINDLGGLKWIGTRQSYDLKKLGEQFAEKVGNKKPLD